MGTQCAERQAASTLQQTALPSQEKRPSESVSERGREGGRVIILPFCLLVISGEHTDKQGQQPKTV